MSWWKFPSISSPWPRIAQPCLTRSCRLEITFRRQCLFAAFSWVCAPESSSPMPLVVEGKVSSFSIASLWHKVFSCLRKAIVLSLQLKKPLDTWLHCIMLYLPRYNFSDACILVTVHYNTHKGWLLSSTAGFPLLSALAQIRHRAVSLSSS